MLLGAEASQRIKSNAIQNASVKGCPTCTGVYTYLPLGRPYTCVLNNGMYILYYVIVHVYSETSEYRISLGTPLFGGIISMESDAPYSDVSTVPLAVPSSVDTRTSTGLDKVPDRTLTLSTTTLWSSPTV